ncbi:InlB B-repeat-containing protein [Candidatus Saccharibacteria bacterium]|nr:InlB B-repeat-containing protein [Candidatus Saccharibacteria bacterium]
MNSRRKLNSLRIVLAVVAIAFSLSFLSPKDASAAKVTLCNEGGKTNYGSNGSSSHSTYHYAVNDYVAYCATPASWSPVEAGSCIDVDYEEWNNEDAKKVLALAPGGPLSYLASNYWQYSLFTALAKNCKGSCVTSGDYYVAAHLMFADINDSWPSDSSDNEYLYNKKNKSQTNIINAMNAIRNAYLSIDDEQYVYKVYRTKNHDGQSVAWMQREKRSVTRTLSYNANGGNKPSGKLGNQTCSDSGSGCQIRIPGDVPTLSGYNFKGWNTASNGTGTSYAANGSITVSADTTLYAKWARVYNHSISYNANGGANAPGTTSSGATESSSSNLTVSTAAPTRSGYIFRGWNDKADGTGTSYSGGQTIAVSGAKTLYAKWEAIYYASFAGSIPVSSRNLTAKADSGGCQVFHGNGYDTSYALSASYIVTRTNGTPSSAASRYNYSNASQPSSPGANMVATLTNGNSKTTPADYNITVRNGETNTYYFYLSFDSSVGYTLSDSVIRSQDFSGRVSKCVKVYNPRKYTATFSASISAASGTGLSGSADSRTGNGLRGRFTLTPTYTIKRTNNSPTSAVLSQYAVNAPSSGGYNGNNIPGTNASRSNSNALTNQQTHAITGSGKSVDVNIGDSNTQCFYMRYDTNVDLVGDSDSSAAVSKRDFAGTTYKCITISNPAQSYNANFSGSTTSARIDDHDKLLRDSSDPDHVATIDNQKRIVGTGTDSDGSFVDDFPSSSNYTASFTHKITRTDEDKSSSASTTYYVPSARVNWQLQYCEDEACTRGSYSNYSASLDDNSRLTTSGSSSLGAKASVEITAKPKWTLNAANKGKYIYHCQRIAYNNITSYKTATNTQNRDTYSDSITSYNSTIYSSPLCVTLKNPYWRNNIVQSYVHHYIDVKDDTRSTVVATNGARATSASNSYGNTVFETTSLNSTFYFDHSLTRHDNLTVAGRNSTNFDETDANVKFYQPSIYRNSNYNVGTALGASGANNSLLKFYGSEILPGTRNTVSYTNPIYDREKSIAGYPVSLNANNKNTGDTFSSNETNGRTSTAFNANLSGTYSLLAGDTKNFAQGTYNLRGAWVVQYKHVYRQEMYINGSNWANSHTGAQFYDRTEKVSAAPRACNLGNGTDHVCTDDELQKSPVTPLSYDSRASAPVYSVTRPYHFEISAIEPNNVGLNSNYVTTPDTSFTVSYTIDVSRPSTAYEYITDPSHTGNSRYVEVLSYVIPVSASKDAVKASGITMEHKNVSDLCSVYRSIAGNSCTILSSTDSSHAPKLRQSGTDPNPLGEPSNAADTAAAFKHVYNRQSYKLSYQTSTITVPKDGSVHVGDKYCVAIAIRDYRSPSGTSVNYSNRYYISQSTCRSISKNPSLAVKGGSVLTAGGIKTSQTTYNNTRFGSWADFAIIASQKPIHGISSGAVLQNGTPDSASVCTRSPLTITNSKCASSNKNEQLGNSNVSARADYINNLTEYFASSTLEYSALPSYISSGVHVINIDSDLTITKNLQVGGAFSNRGVPQAIIIARNINIAEGVTRIDALLVAKGSKNSSGKYDVGGTINTCTTNTGGDIALSNTTCANPLKINGAMVANKILYRRTYGADPNSPSGNTVSSPAETVNYSASTLLWGMERSTSASTPTTVYLKKMPVRY